MRSNITIKNPINKITNGITSLSIVFALIGFLVIISIIENKILVELKAKPFIKKEDYEQTMRYLMVKKIHLGLLVNFKQEYLKPKN